ncbi:Arginase/deacetylase [Annulohypoxylon maeteangense]|uniref:Arginase/deacetylase n=1 Tax=Annulohypoxylon maeteangense TaxID=1927788 RepID=UPI002008E7F5|nr:Arginase/deacetylase [Annulohypoxylon maeteangense]KAI0889207.1 Arginase/deacetylase [Annulohypoxylon maeteangense]
MASPERSRAQFRLAESNSQATHDDTELVQSLNKLSLSTSPLNSSTRRLSTSPNSNATPQQPARLSSVSPSTRTSSRSPLHRSTSNGLMTQSRSSTPSLLRKSSMNSLHSANGITPSRAPSRRGSAANLLSPSQSKLIMEEKLPPTAAQVASGYLQKELGLLHGSTVEQNPSDTVVILHDACYGHRYSRPIGVRANINDIVERPERIQASVLGLSMAYIRLGERHCDGKYPIHPHLDPQSLPSVPFHIRKTQRILSLTSTTVTNVHGTRWMDELKLMCGSAEQNLALKETEVRRPEINRGDDGPPQEFHKGDLYLCSESQNAIEGALGSVCEAVDEVFNNSSHKRAFVAVRPPGHHCSASYPSGFCWVNNVHVGIMHAFQNHGMTHAAIIDFDLHHGDGSQSITWDHNKRREALKGNAALWKKTAIGYFSLHDINSFPCENGDENIIKNASVCIENAYGQSIWNVHLQEWKTLEEFWQLYRSRYSILFDKMRVFFRTHAERLRGSLQTSKAAIFISGGFDASEWEGAGMQRHKVNVPTEFYARFTRDLVRLASEEGLDIDGRIVSVLEGGYSDRALYSGVFSHLSGLAGNEPLPPKNEIPAGLSHEMSSMIGSVSRRNTLNGNELKLKIPGFPYDPNWWSASELDLLDATMTEQPLELLPRKPRSFTPGNYSSPTQASSARAIDPTKVRRTVSGLSSSTPAVINRPPSPPPPDVPWNVAAHELSKLLIPNDRQINSFKPEELRTAPTKVKRERQSLADNNQTNDDTASVVGGTRKSLRERKPVSYAELNDSVSRRRTVGGPTGLATEKAFARGIPNKAVSGPVQPLNGASLLAANGTNGGMPRPSTSQSIRPESSMSVRSQAPTLNVKKTRPGAPRKESSRAPRKPRAAATTTEGAPLHAQEPVPSAEMPPPPAPADNDPIEPPPGELSSPETVIIRRNANKHLIRVLNAEQREARRRAEAERARTMSSQSQIQTQVPPQPQPQPVASENGLVAMLAAQFGAARNNDSSPNGRTGSGSSSSLPMETSDNDLPPLPEVNRSNSTGASTTFAPVRYNQSPLTSSSPVQPAPGPARQTSNFIHYQPDGPPPTTVPMSHPVQILEPNTDVPVQRGRTLQPGFGAASAPATPARHGGHQFTATSDIPFSPQLGQGPRPASTSPKHKSETANEGA